MFLCKTYEVIDYFLLESTIKAPDIKSAQLIIDGDVMIDEVYDNLLLNSIEFKTWASKNKINVFKAPILGDEPEFIYKTNRKGVIVKVKNPNYINTSPKKVPEINKKRVR